MISQIDINYFILYNNTVLWLFGGVILKIIMIITGLLLTTCGPAERQVAETKSVKWVAKIVLWAVECAKSKCYRKITKFLFPNLSDDFLPPGKRLPKVTELPVIKEAYQVTSAYNAVFKEVSDAVKDSEQLLAKIDLRLDGKDADFLAISKNKKFLLVEDFTDYLAKLPTLKKRGEEILDLNGEAQELLIKAKSEIKESIEQHNILLAIPDLDGKIVKDTQTSLRSLYSELTEITNKLKSLDEEFNGDISEWENLNPEIDLREISELVAVKVDGILKAFEQTDIPTLSDRPKLEKTKKLIEKWQDAIKKAPAEVDNSAVFDIHLRRADNLLNHKKFTKGLLYLIRDTDRVFNVDELLFVLKENKELTAIEKLLDILLKYDFADETVEGLIKNLITAKNNKAITKEAQENIYGLFVKELDGHRIERWIKNDLDNKQIKIYSLRDNDIATSNGRLYFCTAEGSKLIFTSAVTIKEGTFNQTRDIENAAKQCLYSVQKAA